TPNVRIPYPPQDPRGVRGCWPTARDHRCRPNRRIRVASWQHRRHSPFPAHHVRCTVPYCCIQPRQRKGVPMSATRPPATRESQVRQVIAASFIGTTVEWYDFFLYGTASALVFNKLFFPEFSDAAGT